MVLVSLQAEFSDRKMDDAILIRLQAMPLHQHIEQRHGEGKACLDVAPRPLTQLLELANRCQHRQDGLDYHAHVPPPPFAGLHIRRITRPGMKAHVSEEHHLVRKITDQPMKGGVGHVGTRVVPADHQAPR